MALLFPCPPASVQSREFSLTEDLPSGLFLARGMLEIQLFLIYLINLWTRALE